MLRRILLTLDGSPFSEAALPAALTLARKTGGELRLLSALEIPPIFVYPEFRSEDRVKAEEYLAGIARRAPDVAGITSVVREGHVGNEILREAAEWKADVIVMATHGRGGPSRLWMGSTAERCIRLAGRPILLVRPSEPGGVDPELALDVKRVVVPLDGSELAETALPYAAALSTALGVPITLLRVVTFLGAPEFPWAPVVNREMNQHLIAAENTAAEEYLAPIAARLRGEGVEATVRVANDVQAPRAILAEADRDAVVMTTHGLGRVGRTLLGSAADKVVRGSKGPLLIIPAGETPSI